MQESDLVLVVVLLGIALPLILAIGNAGGKQEERKAKKRILERLESMFWDVSEKR